MAYLSSLAPLYRRDPTFAWEAGPETCYVRMSGSLTHKGLTRSAGHLTAQTGTASTLPLDLLWSTLFELLLPIWPSRTTLPSHPDQALGDVWPCPSLERALAESGQPRQIGDSVVVFHKLTQWLCYSIVEAIESEARLQVDRGMGQTGLPEVSMDRRNWTDAELNSIAMADC